MNEIRVILHTAEGDVVSAFRTEHMAAILNLIQEYTMDGKSFTVEQ